MLIMYYMTLVIVICVIRISKSEQLVSHNEAVSKCASKGGLAPAMWFPGVPHTVRYPDEARTDVKTYGDFNNLQLSVGESAWVGGYARYGTILALHGCFTLINNNSAPIMLETNNTLYECSEKCKYVKYTYYVGVKFQLCWCIKTSELDYTLQRSKCDAKYSIGVYFAFKKNLNQKAQCLAAKMNYMQNQKTKGHSFPGPITKVEKCTNKHSSVCTNRTFRKEDQCGILYDITDNSTYCLLDKRTSWTISYDSCVRMQGRLLPQLYGIFYYNAWFWTGQFRPFTMINKTTEMSEYECLMVTRIGPDLILEPNDCSISLPILCANNLVSNKIDSPKISEILENTNMIAGLVSLVCVIFMIVSGIIVHKRRTFITRTQGGGPNRLDGKPLLSPINAAIILEMDSSRKDDPDCSNPVDIYTASDYAITQSYKLDIDKTTKQSMNFEQKNKTDCRLPPDATAKDDPQPTVYDIASNYPKHEQRDTHGLKNVYSHCVMVKNGSSTCNDYDVASKC